MEDGGEGLEVEMAVTEKVSDPIWIALRDDEALLDVPDADMREYLLTRDISILDIDIDRGVYRPNSKPVSLFKVRPADHTDCKMVDNAGTSAYMHLFQNNVVEMKNVLDIRVNVKKNGKTEILDSDVKRLGDDIISEVGSIIHELGQGKNGVDKAFFLEATWWHPRARLRQLRAITAPEIENANPTEQDTSSEDTTKTERP